MYNSDRWDLIGQLTDGATPIAAIGDSAYIAKRSVVARKSMYCFGSERSFTGPMQEVSLSSGWGDTFIDLANQFDDAMG